MRQPIKSGGFGLRSNVETSPAAFLGGVEQSLPHFTGEGGVCPQLGRVLGDWTGQDGTRWQPLLQSGCRTGRELAAAWETLQQEARQCSTYLDQELEGQLAVQVEGMGGGSVDGSNRRAVAHQREDIGGAVLKLALSKMDNTTLKPVRALANRDKLSSLWLKCLPGPDGISSPNFSDAMALLLCMPSPACIDRIGARVGRRTVDIFGDSIMSEVFPGDH